MSESELDLLTVDDVLEWARGVEPATFEETPNKGLETRRKQYEARLEEDRAAAKRLAQAMQGAKAMRTMWDATAMAHKAEQEARRAAAGEVAALRERDEALRRVAALEEDLAAAGQRAELEIAARAALEGRLELLERLKARCDFFDMTNALLSGERLSITVKWVDRGVK